MCKFLISASLFLFVASSGALQGGTIYVPDDYSTIQAAIYAAATGDTIVVRAGIYHENIDFVGQAVTVRSESGPDATIIDASGYGSVVTFCSGEGRDSVLDGFTVTNGLGTENWYNDEDCGGGILCCWASPTITNNIIRDNSAGNKALDGMGGGLFCDEGAPMILSNIVMNNYSYDDGAGMSLGLWGVCDAEIINNLIIGNEADNGLGASGGGIDSWNGHQILVNNTISGNLAWSGFGGGIRSVNSTMDIVNCIIWENSAGYDSEISEWAGIVNVDYSDVKMSSGVWPGTDNINENPLFVEGPPSGVAYNDNYLSQVAAGQSTDSPCVDKGDFSSTWNDGTTMTTGGPDVNRVDMGYHYPLPASPGTYYVPDDYATIQAAINDVSAGSTIIVRPGTYYENIDFIGKDINVVSEKGPFLTVIDGSQAGSVVTFNSGESLSAVLDGFTVTNGLASLGGGIYCSYSSPILVNNIITQNTSTGYYGGGGIFCRGGNPLIDSNRITENHADISGGGIRLESCVATVTGNTIARNTANDGGGIVSDGFSGVIEDCLVAENEADRAGGGYDCWASSPLIVNTVFAKNTCDVTWGWGGGLYCAGYSTATFVNCTFAGNGAVDGGAIHCRDSSLTISNSIMWEDDASGDGKEIYLHSSSTLTITYSDVEGGQGAAFVESGSTLNWGSGMISLAPLFHDSPANDYHLRWTSPCRDAGDNSASNLPDKDFEGDPRVALNTVDMGADEYYYHLYPVGSVVPGQGLILRIVGGPGMPVKLYLDNQVEDPPLSTQYGDFHLPWPPLWQGNVGTVPGIGILNLSVTVPSSWNAGDQKPLQALVGPLNGPYTKLTNLMLLHVE